MKVTGVRSFFHKQAAGAALAVVIVLGVSMSCAPVTGGATPQPVLFFPGEAVVKLDGGPDRVTAMLDIPRDQTTLTRPEQRIVTLNRALESIGGYNPPADWDLIDFAATDDGSLAVLLAHWDTSAVYPLRFKIALIDTASEPGFASAEYEIDQITAGTENPPNTDIGTLERARLHVSGGKVTVLARWVDNAADLYRFSLPDLAPEWSVRIEPPSFLNWGRVYNGNYDNFKQTERTLHVYLSGDPGGNTYIAVTSGPELIVAHDSYFGENLGAQTNPDEYDYQTAIVTRVSPQGVRDYARLAGHGYLKRILDLRFVENELVLIGRERVSREPGGWDAWLLRANPQDGTTTTEERHDVSEGDMFWTGTMLRNGTMIFAGSYDYTQNPHGNSVSDARKALAYTVDRDGETRRIALPQGPSSRGSEAVAVFRIDDGTVAFGGIHNAPGTHAPVYGDGFVTVVEVD